MLPGFKKKVKNLILTRSNPLIVARQHVRDNKWRTAIDLYKTKPSGELNKSDILSLIKCYRMVGDIDSADKEIKNAIQFIGRDYSLLVEQSLVFMLEKKWPESRELWREIALAKNLSKIDAIRYLRVLEEIKDWAEYEKILNVILDSQDYSKEVTERLTLLNAVKALNSKRYSECQRYVDKLKLVSSKVWPVNQSTVKYLKDTLDRNKPLISVSSKSDIVVISNRKDGLGERLNALVAGVYLSKRLNCSFAFEWEGALHSEALNFGGKIEDDKGHAISDKSELFSEKFIDKFFRDDKKQIGKSVDFVFNKASTDIVKYYASKNGVKGFNAPRVDLDPMLEDLLVSSELYSFREAFQDIGFSDKVLSLLNQAKNKISSNTVAIHIRTGDVFYGQYRKFLHYSYKGMCLPLIEKLIMDEKKQGNQIVLFGQENGLLSYLKNKYHIIISNDLVPNDLTNTTEVALYEIALMSSCKTIIAGSSGFAKISARISNNTIEAGIRKYPAKQQTEFILSSLSDSSNHYNEKHSAFSYWYAYFYGRHDKSTQYALDILEKASQHDPDNEMYKLVMCFLSDKLPDKNIFNNLAKSIIDIGFDYESHEKSSFKSVLLAKTSGKLNLLEYINTYNPTQSNGNYNEYGIKMKKLLSEALSLD
ncbi:hypothetical protein AB4347_16940 [Vibrio breoganii]